MNPNDAKSRRMAPLITPTDLEGSKASAGRQLPDDLPDQGADAPRSPGSLLKLGSTAGLRRLTARHDGRHGGRRGHRGPPLLEGADPVQVAAFPQIGEAH